MDKKHFFLFLLEHLQETYTVFALKIKLKKYYSLQEIDDILEILIKNEGVLQKIHNPYPSEICDNCDFEVELEKKENGYSALHRCGKIEKNLKKLKNTK